MEQLFKLFDEDFQQMQICNLQTIKEEYNVEILKNIFNCIDLTSLKTDDNIESIKLFCTKVKYFQDRFADMPNVAAVCVYPVFAPVARKILSGTGVKKAVVSAGFPSSQTFAEIKAAETKQALDYGANEIDIVISVGEFLSGNYGQVAEEIKSVKWEMGNAKLKVILETGMLVTAENIWKASLIAMNCGADFIKTSTGKTDISATPEAGFVMLHAIKAFYEKKGKKVGFKPAGGIVTVEDAMIYWSLVKNILGDEWLNNNYFRIGASRLANNVLTEIERIKGSDIVVNYF